ncbi:MAG: transporter ATP-binding protein [Marmoricola sp.]|nr:transporter ATP-binding protein [Marmoricola sp.]
MTATSTHRADEPRAGDRGQISGAEIRLENVVKRYPGQQAAAVDGLSLVVPAGEIVMFVGPSGCGKTTSLKMINRLIEPTSGSIHIGDQDISGQGADQLRRTIGYVIQGGSLFPHMTVARNIAIVPKLLGWEAGRIAERVDELLELVNLDPAKYRDRYPRELSGGQQQRVGVARGLAADPPVILMDEPFGAVDPITRQRLQDELLSIQRELRKTIVCVTHDIDEAIKLGDRILILQEGARVAQYDTAEAILASPADDFVADFVGAGSSLKQLSLSRISEVELRRPTTARIGESTIEVKRRAEANGDTAVVVLDRHDKPTAWPWLRQLKGETIHAGAEDLINLDHRATLNDALDTMLTNSHGGAVVTGDRDRYLGVVDFVAVTDFMRTQQEELESSRRDQVPAASDPQDEHRDDITADDGAS